MASDKPCFTINVATAKSRKRSRPSVGGDPNIAFAILKDTIGQHRRRGRRTAKTHLSFLGVHARMPAVQCPDPQTAIAIAKQLRSGSELRGTWERIGLCLPINESSGFPRAVLIRSVPSLSSPNVLKLSSHRPSDKNAGGRASIATARSALPPRDCPCCPHTIRTLRAQACRPLRSNGRCHSESRRASRWRSSQTRRPIQCLHDPQGACRQVRPASSAYWVSLPSFQLASPFVVPIQRVPSRAASRLQMLLEGRC